MNPWLTILVVLGTVLSLAAGLIWIERRLLALWQDRYGPNRVGPAGLLQPVADAIKLVFKQDRVPRGGDALVFVAAPAIVTGATLLSFAIVPIGPDAVVAELDIGLLFFLGMASLSTWSVLLAGWSSSNRYALLGGLRAAAQMLTYEVFMGLSLMGVVLLAGSFELTDIVAAQQEGVWFVVTQPVGFAVFLVAGLAVTHRLPLDLPEAESELVAGYHSEYSSMKFGLFFVGEYVAVVLVSALTAVLFLGGWDGPLLPGAVWLLLKTLAVVAFFVLLRASLPRPRFDQLLAVGWKVLLPLALLNLLATGAIALVLHEAPT